MGVGGWAGPRAGFPEALELVGMKEAEAILPFPKDASPDLQRIVSENPQMDTFH